MNRNERIRRLAALLGYAKQLRAMVFAGFLTPRDSEIAARGAAAVMDADEVTEAEARVATDWAGRPRCEAEHDGERCQLFAGHGAAHYVLAVRSWEDPR